MSVVFIFLETEPESRKSNLVPRAFRLKNGWESPGDEVEEKVKDETDTTVI